MGLENIQRDGFVLADSESLFDWARTGSLWPMTFDLDLVLDNQML